jgi:hypothetical protein
LNIVWNFTFLSLQYLSFGTLNKPNAQSSKHQSG